MSLLYWSWKRCRNGVRSLSLVMAMCSAPSEPTWLSLAPTKKLQRTVVLNNVYSLRGRCQGICFPGRKGTSRMPSLFSISSYQHMKFSTNESAISHLLSGKLFKSLELVLRQKPSLPCGGSRRFDCHHSSVMPVIKFLNRSKADLFETDFSAAVVRSQDW